MITGTHIVLNSVDPEADRAFFRDILNLTHVDVGHGWLIFALPPAEIAIHPTDKKNNGNTDLFLMCEDIEVFIKTMKDKKVSCEPISKQRWGLLTQLTLPGGSKVGVYQPLHERPGN